MAALSKLSSPLPGVLSLAGLDAGSVQMMDGCATAEEGLLRLEAAQSLKAAVRLCAFALPKREAVWWASQCATHTRPTGLPVAALEAQAASEAWVRRPDEANRHAAMARAQAAGLVSAEAWAAVAAFWCGESMAPPGQPVVPPGAHLVGTAVAGAVALAAVRDRPEREAARLTQFLLSARDIAANGAGVLPPEPA